MYGATQPGLLEKLGVQREYGNALLTEGDAVVLIKDFTTILSMRREKRAAILSQLREIHDGEFRRSFGTGETKIWRGRITVIAAVTPALDRHYSIFSTLGERFLQVRWHRPDSSAAGEWAIRQQGREEMIRSLRQRGLLSMGAGLLEGKSETRICSLLSLCRSVCATWGEGPSV